MSKLSMFLAGEKEPKTTSHFTENIGKIAKVEPFLNVPRDKSDVLLNIVQDIFKNKTALKPHFRS